MNRSSHTIFKMAAKKFAVIGLIAASAVASFATLGDGNKKKGTNTTLFNRTNAYKPGSFSLRSGYNFRGNQILTNASSKKYISINTTVSIQRGNSIVIVPLKKTVVIAGTGGVKLNLSRR